jgi:hypothetical protein
MITTPMCWGRSATALRAVGIATWGLRLVVSNPIALDQFHVPRLGNKRIKSTQSVKLLNCLCETFDQAPNRSPEAGRTA